MEISTYTHIFVISSAEYVDSICVYVSKYFESVVIYIFCTSHSDNSQLCGWSPIENFAGCLSERVPCMDNTMP